MLRVAIHTALAALIFLAASCAPPMVPSATRGEIPHSRPQLLEKGAKPVTVRKCSESPWETAKEFLRGIKEFNLTLLRTLVPAGASILAIFGDGDPQKGRRTAEELISHPAKAAGHDIGIDFELISLEQRGPIEYEAVVERLVEITARESAAAEEKTTAEVHRRRFLAVFDPRGNCLIHVIPLDGEWIPKDK